MLLVEIFVYYLQQLNGIGLVKCGSNSNKNRRRFSDARLVNKSWNIAFKGAFKRLTFFVLLEPHYFYCAQCADKSRKQTHCLQVEWALQSFGVNSIRTVLPFAVWHEKRGNYWWDIFPSFMLENLDSVTFEMEFCLKTNICHPLIKSIAKVIIIQTVIIRANSLTLVATAKANALKNLQKAPICCAKKITQLVKSFAVPKLEIHSLPVEQVLREMLSISYSSTNLMFKTITEFSIDELSFNHVSPFLHNLENLRVLYINVQKKADQNFGIL